jgi:hypothetical protein
VEFCLGESQMINRHIVEHHIEKLETNLVEIISDENGHVKAVITDKETINCELVGLTTGVSPNIDFKKFWNRIRKRNQSESISGNECSKYLRLAIVLSNVKQ